MIISHGGVHRSTLETLKIMVANSIHLHNCDVLKVSPPKDELALGSSLS
ncbi:MAG: hypothetical protein K2X53_05175 [Alphaproteobacteria bacterium]|nr:hypothetical protein [Alphaproteobacteria bacterium]